MRPKRRIIPLFIPNYGCGNCCVFCEQRRISGAAVPVCAEDVYKAVMNAKAAFEHETHSELAFYGGSFTSLPINTQNELLDAAKPFLSFQTSNSIRISVRPDALSPADAARLKSYGVRTIEIGAQSMCDDVLEAARRGHTAADVENASKTARGAGLALIIQIMTGLPRDTNEKSIYTAKRIIDLRPDGVRIYPTAVIRGTELFEMWKRGDYSEHKIEDAADLCADLCVLFENAEIPIIRLGLNPTERLSSVDVAAGAYHPAFGELVYSRLYYRRAAEKLAGTPPGSEVTIEVARGCVSKMIGQRRGNIRALTENFSLRAIKIIESDIPIGEIRVCR